MSRSCPRHTPRPEKQGEEVREDDVKSTVSFNLTKSAKPAAKRPIQEASKPLSILATAKRLRDGITRVTHIQQSSLPHAIDKSSAARALSGTQIVRTGV